MMIFSQESNVFVISPHCEEAIVRVLEIVCEIETLPITRIYIAVAAHVQKIHALVTVPYTKEIYIFVTESGDAFGFF